MALQQTIVINNQRGGIDEEVNEGGESRKVQENFRTPCASIGASVKPRNAKPHEPGNERGLSGLVIDAGKGGAHRQFIGQHGQRQRAGRPGRDRRSRGVVCPGGSILEQMLRCRIVAPPSRASGPLEANTIRKNRVTQHHFGSLRSLEYMLAGRWFRTCA